ncbi:hypothetical protein OIU78_024662 [Salix suchowensis]|nr:hypothetical protein OIU78_024662 [Salix suchowensis]
MAGTTWDSLMGIFCALAISRVRVSSIIVFPASVLVFAVGFSFGFVRGGSFNEFNVNAIKRKAKEEFFRVYSERLRSLVGFFDGFDVEASDLKNDIQRAIDSKEIKLGDLENYVNVIHSIKVSALNARNVVEANIVGAGNVNGVLVENQKSSSSSKGKEIGEVGFELLKFVGGLFGEKAVSSRTSKVKEKEIAKQGTVKGAVNFRAQGNNLTPVIEEEVLNAADNEKANRDFLFSQGGDGKRLVNNEEYLYQNNRLQFMDNHDVYWKMDQNNETETWKSQDNPFDSVDFGVSLEQMETETSFVQKQMYKKSSGAYRSSHTWKMSEDERYRSQLKEGRVNDDLHLGDHQSVPESEVVSSSSSVVTDDVVFDRHLTEANNLLKTSQGVSKGEGVMKKCEELLVEAGRKYRLALSIDGNDVRALYNWGLALSFRAQLIADIGPEAAYDADKVFLAAIDKFDAMMSKGNVYAPDALYRWGVVLQQRSRLRPTNSREKVKLLQQARRLYEDALHMDSNNLQVREALLSCMSELNHRLL